MFHATPCRRLHSIAQRQSLRFSDFAKRFFAAGAAPPYDVAVIGGGPGGYVAAIKAAQLGLKVACIEERGALGGTCLNVGCIPSKALLNITHKYHDAQHNFPRFGITASHLSLDVPTMQKQKAKIVKSLTSGIEMLFKANKIVYLKGHGRFRNPSELQVNDEIISSRHFVIATGSEPSPMPGGALTVDGHTVLTSTEALELEEVPKRMVVVGGGVIGLEIGSVYARLGTEIIVVEFMKAVAPGLDRDVSAAIQKLLEKQGMQFLLGHKVTGAEVSEGKARVMVEEIDSKKEVEMECDKVLVSVGRRPYTDGLGLETIDGERDKGGRIVVDEDMRLPNHQHIFAIGDVIRGPMLAHKAEEEGIAVAETIAGGRGHVNYNAVPSVVYTYPEVAGVGQTEDQLKDQNVAYAKSTFPLAANSRAKTNDETDGFVKILTEKETDRILGGWIVAPNAGELIQEIVLGIEYGASSEDIARTCHAHPTLSEAVKEACLGAHAKPIHNFQRS